MQATACPRTRTGTLERRSLKCRRRPGRVLPGGFIVIDDGAAGAQRSLGEEHAGLRVAFAGDRDQARGTLGLIDLKDEAPFSPQELERGPLNFAENRLG